MGRGLLNGAGGTDLVLKKRLADDAVGQPVAEVSVAVAVDSITARPAAGSGAANVSANVGNAFQASQTVHVVSEKEKDSGLTHLRMNL